MTERIWNDCPECGKACRFKADYVGDLGRCNHCDAEFRIRKLLSVALAVAEPVRRSPEEKILDSLAEWLEHREFMIEGKWQNPSSRTEVWTGKAVGFAAKRLAVALIGHRLPGLRTGVSGGATPEQVGKAMEPILHQADFVAVQFGSLFSASKSNRIIAVILADELRPNEIVASFQKLMEAAGPVAKLGLKVASQRGAIFVHPLVVYTRSKWYEADAGSILKRGYERWFWGKIYMQAAVIDVQKKRIEWAKTGG